MKTKSPSRTVAAKIIPESEWRWHGFAAHFCCGEWCRFHMATTVGEHLVSTVGKYVHPSRSGGSEKTEQAWLLANPEGEEIGCGRTYETMVFKTGKLLCPCGCGMPTIDGAELDSGCYQNSKDAAEGHMRLCHKWADSPHTSGEQK